MSSNAPPLAHHFADLDQQRESLVLGMWIFLATELLLFGGMFAGYTVYRTLYHHAFEVASRHLLLAVGGPNTIILLASSLTMALAVHAAQVDARRRLRVCLVLTAVLGAAFLALKFVEYYIDYQEHLIPVLSFHPQEWVDRGVDPGRVQLFLAFYYIMTGIHAVHLTAGVGLVATLAVMSFRGHFRGGHFAPVEVSGLYWHFVDVIWLFLLPLLYLVGTRHSWM